MNGPEIMTSIIADIERDLREYQPRPAETIPRHSPDLAVALLQKSLRRGHADLALAVADMLTREAPDRLWRRLAVIAIEDVGLGDLDAVYTTVVASAFWRRLARRFGDQRLVSFVVSRLAAASKCRAADDLLVTATSCPAWRDVHLELAELHLDAQLDLVARDASIERRAIALRLAMGTDTVGSGTRRSHRRADVVFDFMCEIGLPHTLVEVSRAAYRQTGEVLCAFLPILYREFDGNEAVLVSDDFPPETMIDGIPSWALDGFTKAGRRALAYFLNADCGTTRWLRANILSGERMAILRHAQFRVEAGLVADRLVWPTGRNLRRQADLHSWPFPLEDAAELLSLMQADIGILNRAREATHGR